MISFSPRYRRGMRIAALAAEAVLSPAVGAWVGFKVDQRFDWFPWATLAGLLVGGAAAAKLFFEVGKRSRGNEDEE